MIIKWLSIYFKRDYQRDYQIINKISSEFLYVDSICSCVLYDVIFQTQPFAGDKNWQEWKVSRGGLINASLKKQGKWQIDSRD